MAKLHMRFNSLLLALLLTCTAASAAAAKESFSDVRLSQELRPTPPLTSGTFHSWMVMSAGANSELRVLWGSPVPMRIASPVDLAQDVLLGLGVDADFRSLTTTTTPSRTYRVFRQYVDDLPVLSGRLDIALNKRGEAARIRLADYSSWPTVGLHRLSAYAAGEHLALNREPAHWQVVDSLTFACWYPDLTTRELRAAYWIQITGPRPHQRYFGVVDAVSGERMLEWPGIAHDNLDLHIEQPYWQPYDHSPTQIAPCVSQNVEINGTPYVTSSAGNVSVEAGTHADVISTLTGPYVEVINDDTGEEAIRANIWNAPYAPTTWGWSLDDATRPEFNLFYHTEFIHDWYKIIDPEYDALDYPMPAVANYGSSYDNAFWNGWGTYYGSGQNYGDFAMYSDVIYHEYTHGVTDGIYPNGMLPYVDQPGAMNEAWSDYFACTINGDPLMAEWLSGNANTYFRDLAGHMHYPENWVGEVHGDSPFISAPLWRIRTAMGTDFADSLAHFARYALTETFFDYFVAVLETDDDDGDLSNGTPNDAVIYDAFGQSGIGPGVEPNFVLQSIAFDDGLNGNGFVEAGETVTVTFTLFNDVTLYPPTATNISLVASEIDDDLTLNGAVHSPGQLGPRDSVTVGPIQVVVAAGASDHWGVLHLSIAADQLTEPFAKDIEFTIGIPQIRIVTRDVDSHVDNFVTSALRTIDKIFVHERLETTAPLDLSALPDTGLVLWLSGDLDDSGLLPGDRAALGNFVSNGGYLALSGQDILGGIAGTPFADDLLGVDIAGYSQLRMATTLADPFAHGDTYLIAGSGGAANQDSMTVLDIVGTAEPVLRYGPAGASVAAAVGQTGRTMVIGFGIEAVSDRSHINNRSREEFLDRMLMWAGHSSSLPSGEHLQPAPADFALTSAYPNPFNSEVRIEFQTGHARDARLVIYDVLGREVFSAADLRGSGTFAWQPSLASGSTSLS
ncbi:MAG: hypothetical protein IPG71_07725 [bacterium]|nr:hypothetical protein [bacterium]